MESNKKKLQVEYEQFTSLFNQACQDLKPGEMLHSKEFNLHDSMLSIELGDPKMDLKVKLEDAITLEKALANQTIKKPQDLTIKEINGLFDGVLGKEILWLQGLSLPHTIYTLAYLYDPEVYEDHQFIKPYLDAIYLGGAYCQDLLRHASYLREDDYVALGAGFVPTKSFDEVNQALVNAEHELEDNLSQKKKKKKKQDESKASLNEYDALNARLRLRRGLLNLYSCLKAKFTGKMRDQVQNLINSCLKTLEIVRETLEHSENCENYFIDSINKTLLIHMPPRNIKTISKPDALNDLASMLTHLQTILEISTLRDLYDIQKSLQAFSLIPRNIVARAYLDANIFQNETYFGEISVKQLALNALEEFAVGKGKKLVSNDRVIKFVEENIPILEEMLSNNLRNRSQQRRKISKTYHNLTAFTQDAYRLDQELFGKGDEKNHVLFLWVIDFALKLMIRQLLEGFEQNIYADEDHCMIFYFTDHIFGFLDRNFNNVVSRYDKEFLAAWQTKQDLPKKKKKLTEFQKRFFYESLYYKAIQNYIRIMLRLSSIVICKGLIQMPEEQELKSRYYLRLRIFDRAYFLGKNEFEDYQQTVQLVEQKELEVLLKEYKGSLEANVKLLNEITSDESFDQKMKTELDKFKRVCVMTSLAIMKIEMNKTKLNEIKATFKNTEHPHYPILDIQKK